MLTIDQLRMLDALERHGTITEAARALSLTQPAASRLLARTGVAAGWSSSAGAAAAWSSPTRVACWPRTPRALALLTQEQRAQVLVGHAPDAGPAVGSEVVPLAALRDARWIVGAQSARRRTLERAAARAGFAPVVASVQTDQQVIQGLVAAGVGVAPLPAASLEVLHPDLVVRPLEPAPPPRVVVAVHNHPSAVAGPRDALLDALARAGDLVTRR